MFAELFGLENMVEEEYVAVLVSGELHLEELLLDCSDRFQLSFFHCADGLFEHGHDWRIVFLINEVLVVHRVDIREVIGMASH